jgi:alpha-L-fucosidase 2
MPLGDLLIKQNFVDTVTSYYNRELDIANATTTTKFTIAGVTYTREIFASAPDNVIVIRIMSDKPGS